MDENLVFITEYEIFKKKIKRKYRRQNISNAERLKDYNELQKGDYVVHQIHGIGQYLGIETIELKGIHRDYVSIQYQNGDRISIPVEQIQTLSKYVSSDGKAPKLNKLNDGRFKKAKQKVKNQVEDIADDLIKLYAERSQLEGLHFQKMMKIRLLLMRLSLMLKLKINFEVSKKLRKICRLLNQWIDF